MQTNGRTARVDLGPRSQIRDLDLQQGDRIQLTGRRGTVNQQGVFIAERIRSGQNTMTVQRQRLQLQRVEGKLTATKNVRLRESGKEHVLGLVQARNRQSPVLVDLGERQQLQDLSLQKGDLIVVLATPGTIQNERAFFAETIRTQGGTTASLDRSFERGSAMRSGQGGTR